MRERGVVIRMVSPAVAEVSFPAAEGCAGCGICRQDGAGRATLEAENGADAQVGDTVEVEITAGGVLRASAIVYLLPIVALLAGYGVGLLLAPVAPSLSDETAGITGSAVLFAVSLLLLRWYDRREGRRRPIRATVTRILPPDGRRPEDCSGDQ